ncbi:MAG: DUF2181 domain-containing protein [Flavobacteriaceae bacterium]
MTFFSIIKKNKIKLFVVVFFLLLFYLTLAFQNQIFKFWFSSKIWAHRVNSIEKYEEARTVFSGVELDIVYNTLENNFDVNHPPAESINLTLFDFLSSKKEYQDFGIWLDFKNLNTSNHQQAANKLDTLVKTLSINPTNIIVESTEPVLLDLFSKKGFKTSYYLPINISSFSKEDLIIQSEFINDLTSSGSIDFISSHIKDYTFLKENFPNSKIITWIINSPPKIKSLYTLKRSMILFKRNFKVLRDENIEVVLYKFNASQGNR